MAGSIIMIGTKDNQSILQMANEYYTTIALDCHIGSNKLAY